MGNRYYELTTQASEVSHTTIAVQRRSQYNAYVLVMLMLLSLCPFAKGSDSSVTRPLDKSVQEDAEAIVLIIEKADAAPVKSRKDVEERDKRCEAQLEPYKQRWEAMFLAASELGFGKNVKLLPMLAAPGKMVIPRIIQLLTWNADAQLDVAVKVTTLIGAEAIPALLEQ